jgi:hypothetical protein
VRTASLGYGLIRLPEPEPRPSDDSNQAGFTSIVRQRHYDVVLSSLNLPNRSRLRLTLDLIVGIPLLLMLWGLDEVRVRLERITSRICPGAAAKRHEECRECRKTQESSDQHEGEPG